MKLHSVRILSRPRHLTLTQPEAPYQRSFQQIPTQQVDQALLTWLDRRLVVILLVMGLRVLHRYLRSPLKPTSLRFSDDRPLHPHRYAQSLLRRSLVEMQ